MRYLYDNVVVLSVFFILAAFAWLFGGTRAEYIVPVMPWLTAVLVEAMICFPQQHDGETSFEARSRVWSALKKDPLVWTALGFIVLLFVPFLNVGLCPVCDYPAIAAGADPAPTIPFFPFCVNRSHHLNVVMWFVPSLVAVIAVKHAMLKRGKRTLLELVVWNGLALGIVGAVQQVTHAQGPLWVEECFQKAYFFSTFGYPNMAGDYFTTLFAIAFGLWRWHLEDMRRKESEMNAAIAHADEKAAAERKSVSKEGGQVSGDGHHHHSHGHSRGARKTVSFWNKHYYLIPATIFFFCALDTLSRASVMLVTALAVLFFLHTFMCLFSKMKKAQRVKATVFSAVVLTLISLCAVTFMPSDLQREVDTIETTGVLDRVTGKGQYHVRVATEIWKKHPIFGVGGWGYKHFCLQLMTDKELRNIQKVGGANVHNDYLQFLAEHGVVGLGLFLSVILMIVWPIGKVWKQLINAYRFTPPKEQPPQPIQIFVVPAPVFCIVMAAVATIIHAFGDCIFRSPAVLSLFFVSLAAMDGFLPKIKKRGHRS
ncbi:MAG: O-antigen ligase family protein [Kiritimatiellae bacterium]|nr:O-antigen ligase family protein [Kiritimatiellia bacterium]